MGEQDYRVACVQLHLKRRVFMQPGQHADVDHVAFQVWQYRGRVADADRQVDLREGAAIGIDHLDYMKWPHGTQLQLAPAQCAGITQQPGGFGFQRQQLLGNREQLATYASQFDTPATAMDLPASQCGATPVGAEERTDRPARRHTDCHLGHVAGCDLRYPLALLAARNLHSNRWVYQGTRQLRNVIRSINELILALVFVLAVGLGPFPGVLALAVNGVGMLGQCFAESIEEIDQGPLEALRATGARPLQVIMFGVLPHVVTAWTAAILRQKNYVQALGKSFIRLRPVETGYKVK